jgi:uncharacterized protein YceK
MKKLLAVAALGLFALLANGCASLEARSGTQLNVAEGPYPATRKNIAHVVGGPVGFVTGATNDDCEATFNLLAAPFYAVDLPLSLVLDTLFLPHDATSLVYPTNKNARCYAPPPAPTPRRQVCPTDDPPCPPPPPRQQPPSRRPSPSESKSVLDFWR